MTMLVDAMWAVTARECSVEPSVRDIVAEAGLTPKAFYRHFDSKDNLLVLALREGTELLVAHLERRMARQAPGRMRIDAWIRGVAGQAATPDAIRRTLPWSLAMGRLGRDFPREVADNQAMVMAPLEQEIRVEVDAGRSTSPDPGADARVVFSAATDLLRRSLLAGHAATARDLEHLIDFTHRGLGLADR
jgi:AcrR family transcriptional regulator